MSATAIKTAIAETATAQTAAPTATPAAAPALAVVPAIQLPDMGSAFAKNFVRAYGVKTELLAKYPSLGGHVTGWKSKSREVKAKVRGEISPLVTDAEIDSFSEACADLDALDAAAKVCGLPRSYQQGTLAKYEAARAYAASQATVAP